MRELRPPCWPLAVAVLALPLGVLPALCAGWLWAPWAAIALMAVIVVVIRRAQWVELARIRKEHDHGRS